MCTPAPWGPVYMMVEYLKLYQAGEGKWWRSCWYCLLIDISLKGETANRLSPLCLWDPSGTPWAGVMSHTLAGHLMGLGDRWREYTEIRKVGQLDM